MIRKLKCIRTDELGHVVPAAWELCRYVMKPLTETVCNDDIPCDRKRKITTMLLACPVKEKYQGCSLSLRKGRV